MIELIRGDTHTLRTTVYEDSSRMRLQDLAGVTAIRVTARTTVADETAVFEKMLGAGISIVNAQNGLIETTLLPSDTASLPSQRLVLQYDVEITFGDGRVVTVDRSEFRVIPDVSV